ncbi:unnamed protein product, partial [Clonostachys chloroleuca]
SITGISKQLPLLAAVLLVVTTRASGFSDASQDLVPCADIESSDGSAHTVYARDRDLYINYLLNRRSLIVAPKATGHPNTKAANRPKSAANPIAKGAICRRGPGDKDGAKCEPTGGSSFVGPTDFEAYKGTPAPPPPASNFKVNSPNKDLPVAEIVPVDQEQKGSLEGETKACDKEARGSQTGHNRGQNR